MSKSQTYKLPAETAAEYDLVDWPKNTGPEQFFGSVFRKVNVETLTLKQAERLVRQGFPYLKKKTKKAVKAEESK